MIVVTGGAGFIGSGIVRHLNNQGVNRIVIVDDLNKPGKKKNLEDKQYSELIPKKELFDWLKGKHASIQAFIHMGACSSTLENNVPFLVENNYLYSVRLCEYALEHKKRFIYASSAATYGDGSRGFEDDHAKLEEHYPLNRYGYYKHLFDLWLKNQDLLNSVVGLKFFNVFGPNESHKGRMASAITHILPAAQREGEIKLFKSSEPKQFGDGEQKRDFIYVKDAARMLCQYLHNDSMGIYNIGSGVANTWNDLANAVFKAIHKTPNIRYIDMPPDLVGKYQNYTCASMDKTRKELQKAAVCAPLEDSVIEYVRDHLLTGTPW